MTARLHIQLPTETAPRTIVLDPTCTIGRVEGNYLVIDDSLVSRHHALVRLLGGDAEDDAEASVLAQLGPGSRRLGDIVAGVLVGGDRDEYDTLQAVQRLAGRGVVRVEVPGEPAWTGGGPQPELER